MTSFTEYFLETMKNQMIIGRAYLLACTPNMAKQLKRDLTNLICIFIGMRGKVLIFKKKWFSFLREIFIEIRSVLININQ